MIVAAVCAQGSAVLRLEPKFDAPARMVSAI